MRRFCRGWSVAVGAMDAATGLLLVARPERVLAILGIGGVAVEAMPFVRWIGVFVAAVGLSYAWTLKGDRVGEAVWGFTALARALVAVFVTASVVGGTLEPAWVGVAATDAAVAVVQAVGLGKRWWR